MIWEQEVTMIVSLESDLGAYLYPNQKGMTLAFNDVR